jgi:hypothetical protein
MTDNHPTKADRQSELLDVQLLDAFAEIEALLRAGREVQRHALRVRGLPVPVSAGEREDAGHEIVRYLKQMGDDCRMLEQVVRDLQETAAALESALRRDEALS